MHEHDDAAEDPELIRELSGAVFYGLQLRRHIYAGTVPDEVVAVRRARNRMARYSRRGNVAAIRRQARRNSVANRGPRFARGQAPDPLGLHAEVEQ